MKFAVFLRPIQSKQNFRLVRGSHIVVRKLFEHPYAYIFQNKGKRFLFCIPYERDFTLIGTTEIEMEGPNSRKEIKNTEVDYLCQAANQYLREPVSSNDVVWSYSGVRAFYDDNMRDAKTMTPRDYTLKFDVARAPIVSVYGGKISTYRQLAEDVLALLEQVEGSISRSGCKMLYCPVGTSMDTYCNIHQHVATTIWMASNRTG